MKFHIRTEYGWVELISCGKEMDENPSAFSSEEWRLWTIRKTQDMFRRFFLDSSILATESVYTLTQVHGTQIWSACEMDTENSGEASSSHSFGMGYSAGNGISLPEGDGLVTQRPGDILVVRTADCVPLFLWGISKPFLGMLHIGWRGASAGILERLFCEHLDPSADYGFLIGPCIRKENYEVGEELLDFFPSDPEIFIPKGNRKYFLDLPGFVKNRIRKQFSHSWFLDCLEDTYSSSEWFSHRRGDAGRNLNAIRFFLAKEEPFLKIGGKR